MNVTPDLDARFRAAALAAGIVDVRFDIVPSPVGDLFVAATPKGLCRISFTPERAEEYLAANRGNRNIVQAHVAAMERDIAAVRRAIEDSSRWRPSHLA